MTTRGSWFTVAEFILLGMTPGLIGCTSDTLTSPERSAEELAPNSAIKEKLLRPQPASESTLNNPTGGVPIQSRPATLKPRWVVSKPGNTRFHKGVSRDQIVVKFKDGIAVRLNPITSGSKPDLILMPPLMTPDRRARMQRQKLSDDLVQTDLIRIKALLNQPSVRQVKPLFSRPDITLQAERHEAEAKTGQEHADLGNYFLVKLKADTHGEFLVDELNAISSVELAYLAPIPVLTQPTITGPTTPNPPCLENFLDCLPHFPSHEVNQGYRNPAPDGIDALYAGTVPGGNGTGTFFVDIEYGWNTEHEDLPKPAFGPNTSFPFSSYGVHSTDNWQIQHGTAVLGEIIAKPSYSAFPGIPSFGATGIAYQAQYGLISPIFFDISWGDFPEDPGRFEFNPAEAINLAASRLTPGNVILIEIGRLLRVEVPVPHHRSVSNMETTEADCIIEDDVVLFLPLEDIPAVFDAIQLATSRGIHVVEPAANGGLNLDHSTFEGKYDRNTRDSGAIMVGASNDHRSPKCNTNRGSRVDVHAWGQDVWTTGTFNGSVDLEDSHRSYTNFSATSAAAPIIAGAVLSIEGARRVAGRPPLSPLPMRNLLRSTGTPQEELELGQIGPQPDLRRAIPFALLECFLCP